MRGAGIGRRGSVSAAGVSAGILLSFIGSWPEVWDSDGLAPLLRSMSGSGGAVTALVALWIAAAVFGYRGVLGGRSPDGYLALAVAALPLALVGAGLGLAGDLEALVASLCVVAYAAAGFREGWRGKSLRRLNEAFLLSIAFAVARFFDLDDSLLYRGLLFLLSGLAIFAFNRFLGSRPEFRPRSEASGDEE